MVTLLQRLQQIRIGRARRDKQAVQQPATVSRSRKSETAPLDIAPENIPVDLTSSASLGNNNNDHWHTLAEWMLPSVPGNERQAMEQVAQAIKELHLPVKRLEKLKTAVAEATMNAMEHGNHFQPDKPVSIRVLVSQTALAVCVTDHGGTRMLSDESEIKVPDLEAKLAELQTPRGWGLFLIKNMVDEMHVNSNATHHTVELIMYLEGDGHASEKS